MTLAEERKKYYLQRSLDNSNNISSGIPWGIIFPKIGSIIPVIPKGYQILWTAGSGIGKTQTWLNLFHNSPTSNIKLLFFTISSLLNYI